MEAAAAPESSEAPPSAEGESAAPEAEDQHDAGDDDRDESGRYLSREAAAYRRRLRDAEAERDQLREQLERVQTAEVERLAAGAGLSAAKDIWMFGATLPTLRNDDGDIDPETVSGLVADLIRDRPGLQKPKFGDFGIGRGASAAGPRTQPAVGLSQLLKP